MLHMFYNRRYLERCCTCVPGLLTQYTYTIRVLYSTLRLRKTSNHYYNSSICFKVYLNVFLFWLFYTCIYFFRKGPTIVCPWEYSSYMRGNLTKLLNVTFTSLLCVTIYPLHFFGCCYNSHTRDIEERFVSRICRNNNSTSDHMSIR